MGLYSSCEVSFKSLVICLSIDTNPAGGGGGVESTPPQRFAR